jgi:hypothetical protein
MKLLKLALLIALLSAGTSAMDSMSGLSGETWFVGTNQPDVPSSDWQNVAESMNKTNSDVSDDGGNYIETAIMLGKILIDMVAGVLFIGSLIADYFTYTVNGVNVGKIIAAVIQVCVWLIYIIGLYQIRHGDSIKHYW